MSTRTATGPLRSRPKGVAHPPPTESFDLDRLAFGPELVDFVRAGIDATAVDALVALLGQPLSIVLATVGISERTWARRRLSILTPSESDHVVRLVRLVDRATGVLGDVGAAKRWLSVPARAFDGQTPLQMAASETGAVLVFDLLGRIEHGVFS